MPSGKVKWFDAKRGYGFIQSADGGPDVFIHHSVVEAGGLASLTEGQAVEFETEQGPKGPKAISIRPPGT